MLLVCCRAIEVNHTFFSLDYNFYVCSISAYCCLCIDATACTFLFLFSSNFFTGYAIQLECKNELLTLGCKEAGGNSTGVRAT